MGSLGYVHGIPAYTMVQMGRDGHSRLPMAWDRWDSSMRSQHTPWYRWVGTDTLDYQWHGILGIRPWDPSIHHGTDGSGRTLWTTNGMGSLGFVHGIPAYTMVQMGRDGHCGLPMAWDPWDTSMGSKHTPRYRWVGKDTVDYQWHGILGIRPWDPSIHHGTDW